jgi:hypothetical protein
MARQRLLTGAIGEASSLDDSQRTERTGASRPSSSIFRLSARARRLATAVLMLVSPCTVAAQSATEPTRASVSTSIMAASLSTSPQLDPNLGGDGPKDIGVGIQAAANLWINRVVVAFEGSTASLSWLDSRPRSLGPQSRYKLRENVGLFLVGTGWPRHAPSIVLKGGVGLRGGAPESASGSPLLSEEMEASKLVVAAALDVTLHNYRYARPILTLRYVRARRSEQEQSVGLGAHLLRVGVGVEFGPQ